MINKTIGERMAILETKVDIIGEIVNKIDSKLDSLPKIYATKKELQDVKVTLMERDVIQDKINDSKWNWISKNWFQILQMIALIVIGIIASKGGI